MTNPPSSHPKRRHRQGETYYEAQAAADAEADRLRHTMPDRRPLPDSTPALTYLTMAVDCPWCIAKAGEPCYIQVPYRMKDRSGNGIERPTDRFHLARVAGVSGSSS